MKKYYINNSKYNSFIIRNNLQYTYIVNFYNFFFFVKLHNYIHICKNYVIFFKKKKILEFLNYYFFSWNSFILKKIKFKHKITWLYIYRLNLQLIKICTNYNKNFFFSFNNFNLKRKKNYFAYHSITIWGVDIIKLNLLIKYIIEVLFLNSYTLRGFKLSRMKIIKRIGKISKYKSLKGKIF